MPIEITMPALSPTMEEGNLAKWHVKEGDTISAGDVVAEIETDKATMEVEAVDEGTIAKILVAEGTDSVKVNAVIAILAEEGEDVSAAASATPAAATDTPAAKEEAPAESPPAQAEAPVPSATPAPAPANADGNRVFASPLARRIAGQNNIELSAVSGSGPHGRIVKSDIEAAIAGGVGSQALQAPKAAGDGAAPAAAPAPAISDKGILALYEEGSYETLAHDNMRKTIAKRLTESSQTIPAYFLSVDCNLDALLKLRQEINAAAPKDKEGNASYKVSVNDFIIKAMALALRDVPMANASWTSEARILHKHADVGVAVAIPDGLITPIVRKAEQKTLSAISLEMKDLAGRARDKKLKPEEYQGGSTAVSNLGMFGVSDFTSIINPPHASIVSIGAGEQRAVVIDGALASATVMTATFAFDHRVIDGALGAQLAGAFKEYMESPMSMLV